MCELDLRQNKEVKQLLHVGSTDKQLDSILNGLHIWRNKTKVN